MTAVPAARAIQALAKLRERGPLHWDDAVSKAWAYLTQFRRLEWLVLSGLEHEYSDAQWEELSEADRIRLRKRLENMMDLFDHIGRGAERANGKAAPTNAAKQGA